jgi:hypothetical protein
LQLPQHLGGGIHSIWLECQRDVANAWQQSDGPIFSLISENLFKFVCLKQFIICARQNSTRLMDILN